MKFIVYALALTLASLSATWAQCNQYNLRKEIRQISSSERNDFIKAVNDLKRSGRYDELVSIHLRHVPYAHSTPAFLPWHRQYIRIFELALQRFNPSVVLPYWDWTLDSQAPENSPIWEWFGGNGRKGDGCVVDGPFAFWRARNPRPHCLQRQWDSGDKISAFWSPESINHFVSVSGNFDNLRNNIEPGPHGSVHNNIGGDFRYMTSANDPIFFLHHAFVDKIWADWQRSHRSMANDYGGINLVDGLNATVNDNLPPFDTRVHQVLSTDNLCYRYAQSPGTQFQAQKTPSKRAFPPITERMTPASKIESLLKNILSYNRPDYGTILGLLSSTDRETQLSKLRPPRGLDEDFSNMMGYDIREVRRLELTNALYLKQLNEEGYISKFSLENGQQINELFDHV